MTGATELDHWLTVARELIAADPEVLAPNWSETTLAVWLRDGCQCVYCGFNLLDDRNFAYHFSSLDHLLPRSKYSGLERDLTNQVLRAAPATESSDSGPPMKLETFVTVNSR